MQITYIGKKALKADNVAGTKLVWTQGQSHEVADLVACAKLLKHTDSWAIDDSAEREAEARAQAGAEQAERDRAEAERAAAEAAAEQAARDEEARLKAEAEAQAEKEAAERSKAQQEQAEEAAELTVDQVREALKACGIKFHPNTGEQKLRAMLKEA